MSWYLNLSLSFAAGAVGGLANGLIVWFFGYKGISQLLGVNIAPKMSTSLIYSKVVWGGLWGLLFAFFSNTENLFFNALLISIPPTLVQLLYVFPKSGAGTWGTTLGRQTPLLVVFFNLAWAYTAAVWIYFAL